MQKSINTNRLKPKKQMIISLDAEKASESGSRSWIKPLGKLGIEGSSSS